MHFVFFLVTKAPHSKYSAQKDRYAQQFTYLTANYNYCNLHIYIRIQSINKKSQLSNKNPATAAPYTFEIFSQESSLEMGYPVQYIRKITCFLREHARNYTLPRLRLHWFRRRTQLFFNFLVKKFLFFPLKYFYFSCAPNARFIKPL